MSCTCTNTPCSCTNTPVANTPEHESLPSQVANFVAAFFGGVVKVAGTNPNTVEWVLPCDMASAEPITGFAREEAEGIGCYLLRYLRTGVTGLDGKNAYAIIVSDFIQPALFGTAIVYVGVGNTTPFAVGQYVFNDHGGFYRVTAIDTIPGTLTLRNEFSPPFNATPGSLVSAAGRLLLPSGAPSNSGPQGAQGDVGPQGPQGDATEWRTGAGVPSNALGKDGDFYLRDVLGTVYKRIAGVYVLQATLTGATGPQGPAGDAPAQFWRFTTPGEYKWTAPFTGNIRIRAYGAGGGGAGGSVTGPVIGNGGGGGEYADRIYAVTSGNVYSCFIGLGGPAGTTGLAGSDGTHSYFVDGVTTVIEALGGIKGGAAPAGAPGNGGTGGAGSAVNRYAGFAGVSLGGVAFGGNCGREGAGGVGGTNAGQTPGGGGSGGLSGSTTGGVGGNGTIIIERV